LFFFFFFLADGYSRLHFPQRPFSSALVNPANAMVGARSSQPSTRGGSPCTGGTLWLATNRRRRRFTKAFHGLFHPEPLLPLLRPRRIYVTIRPTGSSVDFLRGLASPFTRHPPAGGLITRRWTSHSRTCGRNHRSLQKKRFRRVAQYP